MLELLSAEEMQSADRAAVAIGADSGALMEAAGRAVARRAFRMTPRSGSVVVLAGPGNNGGDGYVAARWLTLWQVPVTVFATGVPRTGSDAAAARNAYAGPCIDLDGDLDGDDVDDVQTLFERRLADASLCIDALFGAGLARPLDGWPRRLVGAINAWRAEGRRTLAVDLPSGIDGNAIAIAGDLAVEADHTITFFRYKPVHFVRPTRDYCGRHELAAIGIPVAVLDDIAPKSELNAPGLWCDRLPQPVAAQHKFDRGHVLVRSGAAASTGASRLSAEAALAAGAGLVTLATPPDAIDVVAAHLTAVMLSVCEDALAWYERVADRRITAAVIGPGNGVDAATRRCIEVTIDSGTPCVVDADGITSGAERGEALFARIRDRATPVVFTPHDGEFERLFGANRAVDRQASRWHRVIAAARLAHAVVVLKGSDTIIAAPDGRTRVNANAPAWLATAGSGDVLSGVIAALLAQGMSAFDAASAAVWLHADAGWRAGAPTTAERLLDHLPEAVGALMVQARPVDAADLPSPERSSITGR